MKAPTPTKTNPLDDTIEYTREHGGGGGTKGCRLSLRQGKTVLAVLLNEDVANTAGIKTGKRVHFRFNEKKFVLVPGGGDFTVRKQESRTGIIYPHVLVRVGPDEPLNIQLPDDKITPVEHEFTEQGLVLMLPSTVKVITRK
jgi:hypothetical protein